MSIAIIMMENSVEIYSNERIAEFLLNNALSREDYDQACDEIKQMGLDPKSVPNTDPDDRDSYMTSNEIQSIFANLKHRRAVNKKIWKAVRATRK